MSTEEFTVTASLSEVEGYIYMGVDPGQCETIGPDRWEGEIKAGETKTVSFRLKLSKEASEYRFISEAFEAGVAWSREPLGKNALRSWGSKSVLIKLIDYEELKKRNTEKAKQSLKKNGNTILLQLKPLVSDTTHRRTFRRVGPILYKPGN